MTDDGDNGAIVMMCALVPKARVNGQNTLLQQMKRCYGNVKLQL